MSVSEGWRRFGDYQLGRDFEFTLLQVYRKHTGKKAAFNRKLEFFTKIAEDYFKANMGFTPLETITVDDFPDYSFNERSYAWAKKVIPAFYHNRSGNQNETLELLKGSPSIQTKSRFLMFSLPILDTFFKDMTKGKPANMLFILPFQRLVFELIGEASKFVENDFIGNRRRLNAMTVTFRANVDEVQEFDGVRYQVYPQRPYDFLHISNDDALTISGTVRYNGTLDSTVIQGEPMKLGEVLDEPSVIIPFSLLDKMDLKRILREVDFGDSDDRQPLFRFMKSNFFKNEKWCLMVEGTSAHFLVPKDVVMQRPYDSSVVGGEHE